MNSALTAGDAYNTLKPVIPVFAGGINGGANIAPGTFSDFVPYINQVLERVINSGTWEGTIAEILFNGSTGFITLPYFLQAIVGVQINGWPQQVWSKFTEYVEVGPGRVKSDLQGIGPLIEATETSPTQFRIPDLGVGGPLRIVLSNAADASKSFWFDGKDLANGEVYTSGAMGLPFTSAYPSAATAQAFSDVTNVQLPDNMQGNCSLYVIIAGVDFLLSTYEPQDFRPNYKRYKTGTWEVTRPIAALCRRRYIPVKNTTDWLVPGNLGALRFGLRALFAENSNRDADMADGLWARCYALLNQEHRSRRGKAAYVVNFNPHGAGNYSVLNSH